MDQEDQRQRVLHLWQVEKLSIRQIAKELRMCRKRIKVIIEGTKDASAIEKKTILDEYTHLIGHWYKQHPKLKADQIYERLLDYGYKGSYCTVVRYTQQYRQVKQEVYYPLRFVPGQEAQIDWFFYNDERVWAWCPVLFMYCLIPVMRGACFIRGTHLNFFWRDIWRVLNIYMDWRTATGMTIARV